MTTRLAMSTLRMIAYKRMKNVWFMNLLNDIISGGIVIYNLSLH